MIEHTESLRQAVACLATTAGLHGDLSLHPLAGGANNRVFRLDINGAQALLKVYFRHADDPRDRLGTEYAFSSFCWQHGLRCLPQPLGCDRQNYLGLYEYVPGRRLLPHEVKDGEIRQALGFYRALNQHKRDIAAQGLPIGSEAGFSIADHLERVERRLGRLKALDEGSEINRHAIQFIRNELSETWLRVLGFVHHRIDEIGLTLGADIAPQDRCLSPSDFGFHNAILSDEERLRFIDFEYAGWDDPAKMVCDFFCQPALPVGLRYFEKFVAEVVADMSEPQLHQQRIALLLPVHQVKWCCILLNDFLTVGSQRRRFASTGDNDECRKKRQLRKARRMLQLVLHHLSEAGEK